MDSMSGAPWGNGTINSQSLYGASSARGAAPSPMQRTAPGVHAGATISKTYLGLQLPVLMALGVFTWWLWREYD